VANPPIKLLRENQEALELWLSCQTQWRVGGFGYVGLDYNVVYIEASRLEIDLSKCTMKKIKALEIHTLKEQNSHDRSVNQKSEQPTEGHIRYPKGRSQSA
jgi:hypothetical protein